VIIRFPRSTRGRITVECPLPLTASGERTIRLRIWLPRSHLRAAHGRAPLVALDRLADRIYGRLADFVANSTLGGLDRLPIHPRVLTLSPLPPPICAVIKVAKADLVALDHALNDAETRERFRLYAHLMLPDELLTWSVELPRGNALKQWPLKRALPTAFAWARTLVQAAKSEPQLDRRIWDVINSDPRNEGYCIQHAAEDDQARTVALVERAFRGAWERYRLCSPLTLTPRDALHRYAYGGRSTRFRELLGRVNCLDPHASERQRYLAELYLLAAEPGRWGRHV
jgi:hypothetical protein